MERKRAVNALASLARAYTDYGYPNARKYMKQWIRASEADTLAVMAFFEFLHSVKLEHGALSFTIPDELLSTPERTSWTIARARELEAWCKAIPPRYRAQLSEK